MHATHRDWLTAEPTSTRLRRNATADDPGLNFADEGTSDRAGLGRARLLVGLYATLGLLVQACAASHFLTVEATPTTASGSWLFLGLIVGQVGSCLLWAPTSRGGQLFQHALTWSVTGLSAGLLGRWLGGPFEQWWLGMVILVWGAKAADWAMQQPLYGRQSERSSRPGAFGLAAWISFSLWAAIVLRLLPGMAQQPSATAALLGIAGGLSLWVAIHRFAFRQLLLPTDLYWQRQRHPRTGRVMDAVGILFILSLMYWLLVWGLWQFYSTQALGGWLALVCSVAGGWQALDVAFAGLVAANAQERGGPAVAAVAVPARARPRELSPTRFDPAH